MIGGVAVAELFAANMEEALQADSFEKLMACLPAEEQKRIKKYRRKDDRKRALLGAVLIRSVLRDRTGLKDGRLILSRDACGKPFLAGGEGIHFNLSHSGKWVVCIIDSFQTGVDVQEMRPIDIQLGKRFFSASEYEALTALPKERQLDGFYELWTLKESYMKAVGKGLGIPSASFSIAWEQGEIKLKTRRREKFFFRQYQLEKGYKLAACSKGNPPPRFVLANHLIK